MNSFHLLPLIFFFTQFLVVAHGCYDNERIALLEVKSLLHDPSNLLSSWQQGHIHKNCCNWHGVECSSYSFHVISIDKYRANYLNEYDGKTSPPNALLTGKISPFLFDLTYLEYLDISSNDFLESPIPSYICNLTRLQTLDLSNSNLIGPIPSCLYKMNNLIKLDLSGNNLTGFIPSCLFEFKNLSYLDLSRNNLRGTVPRSFHLKNPPVSTALGLNLSYNNLHGPLPLPPKVIEFFDLSHNKFSGEISVETGVRLSSATYIFLSGNELSGSIPSSLFSVDSSTRYSYLSGAIRGYTFTYVDLSNNKLSGIIPASIGNCSDLYYLNLGANDLTGNVPVELEQLASRLTYLQLNDNKFNGTLNSICKLLYLGVLNLANNNFEGSIPTACGKFTTLKVLSLKSNKFNGPIPEEITHLEYLQILDLSRNYLTGQIPRKLGNLRTLRSRPNDTSLLGGQYACADLQLRMGIKGIEIQLEKVYAYSSGIDLSCNLLEGSIPADIGILKGLSMLNLSHNGLYGVIPASVQSMNGLDSLDLSFNKLSGHIPQSLASLDSLGYLNLSHNNLSGKIPRGTHFGTLGGDGSAYVNNSLLCGFPTKNICQGGRKTDTSSPNEVEEADPNDGKEKLLLYAIAALGFAVGFWGLFFVLLLKKQKWWFPYWRFMDVIAERVASCLLKN